MITDKELRQALPGTAVEIYIKLKKKHKDIDYNTVYQYLLRATKKKMFIPIVRDNLIYKQEDTETTINRLKRR